MSDKPARPAVPDAVTSDVRIFMMLLAACVVVYLFSVPVSLMAMVLGPLAALVGIRALVRSRQVPQIAGLRVAISFGLGLSLMATLAGLGQLILYDVIEDQRECQSQALTNAALRECQVQFDAAYQERLQWWGLSGLSTDVDEAAD